VIARSGNRFPWRQAALLGPRAPCTSTSESILTGFNCRSETAALITRKTEVLWSGCTLQPWVGTQDHNFKEQQKFARLQVAVERKIREAFPGASGDVTFRAEPSRLFFIYRKDRPSLRLDVELAPDSKTIRFATSTRAEGCFVLRQNATGEIQIFIGPARVRWMLLQTCF
jgi:hypothetical protein